LIPQTDIPETKPSMSPTIPPGGIGNTATIEGPTPPEIVQGIQRGGRYYVFGTIWYDDIFGQHHWAQFCYFFLSNLKAVSSPGIHNTCDDYEAQGGYL
jgi:hypothetical protein